MSLTTGTRIGSYEILAALGAGGIRLFASRIGHLDARAGEAVAPRDWRHVLSSNWLVIT